MEIVTVTLAQTVKERDADAQAHARQIVDTLNSVPGLIMTRMYRGRGHEPCYFLLATWEDEESWEKAQEKYNPKQLFLTAPRLLAAQPEQWTMAYLWGYSRPSAQANLVAVHIISVRTGLIEGVQRGWIKGLRRLLPQTCLAFAFLARDWHKDLLPAWEDTGITEPRKAISIPSRAKKETSHPDTHYGTTLLSFFSWANEADREEFYADPSYQTIKSQAEGAGSMRVFPLEVL